MHLEISISGLNIGRLQVINLTQFVSEAGDQRTTAILFHTAFDILQSRRSLKNKKKCLISATARHVHSSGQLFKGWIALSNK